jgi:hypothetical protein
MMVMALATFMTGPALNLIGYILRIKNMWGGWKYRGK